MKKTLALRLVACAAALAPAFYAAAAPIVNISLNAIPTKKSNPNGGGTFTIVAKTDSPIGISAISAYLKNINTAGLTIESDIGNSISPFVANLGGVINLVYGQDIASGPIVAGVGTALKSDGPDPLGDPFWNGATRIFSGTYSSTLPMFTTQGPLNNETDANVLASVIVGQAAIDVDTTAVVRVAVPEPSTLLAAGSAMLGMIAMRRRR
jgi:hypothetical protein